MAFVSSRRTRLHRKIFPPVGLEPTVDGPRGANGGPGPIVLAIYRLSHAHATSPTMLGSAAITAATHAAYPPNQATKPCVPGWRLPRGVRGRNRAHRGDVKNSATGAQIGAGPTPTQATVCVLPRPLSDGVACRLRICST